MTRVEIECPHGMADPSWCVSCQPTVNKAARAPWAGAELWVSAWPTSIHIAHIRSGGTTVCDQNDDYKIRPDGQGGLTSSSESWRGYVILGQQACREVSEGKRPGVRLCKHCEAWV